MDASHSSPSLGNILGKLLCSTPGGIRDKDKSDKGLDGKELKINLGCRQLYPGASPPHLGDRTGKDE